MLIGYDGKRAVENNTGLGNYSRLVIEVLAQRHPDDLFRLYAPRLKFQPRLRALFDLCNVDLTTPDTWRGRHLRSMWRSHGVTRQLIADHVDLFHGLSGELPVNIARAGIPTVVTIHDVIFRRFPQYYSQIDRAIYDRKFRFAAREATRVIAISDRTRRDVMELYDIPADKIDVVYQGCHRQFHTRPSDETIEAVKKKYGLDRPYIIAVGTIEERKNQLQAVRALHGLPRDLDMVLVGGRTPYTHTIARYVEQYHLGERIHMISNADFADFPALYAGAVCSSYTSRYEGFGIPVIESLSVGTPVIIASGSCLEEAAGPSAPVVSPDNVNEFIYVAKELCDYSRVREKIAREGRQWVARFNDDNMADGIWQSYQKAINQFSSQHV